MRQMRWCWPAGEQGRRIRELTSVVQKRWKFADGQVELFAEKVMDRGLCAVAQAESLRYKLLGGLSVRRCAPHSKQPCYSSVVGLDTGSVDGLNTNKDVLRSVSLVYLFCRRKQHMRQSNLHRCSATCTAIRQSPSTHASVCRSQFVSICRQHRGVAQQRM